MAEIRVHKAEPAVHNGTVESVTLSIDEHLPSYPSHHPQDLLATYMADAEKIADGLLAALPGGTVDQLMAELLRRRAALFRVSHQRAGGQH